MENQPPRRMSRRESLVAAGAAAVARQLERVGSAAAQEPPTDIWDAHVHLAVFTGSVENRVDQLLHYADRHGIRRLVLFLGSTSAHDPSPEQVRRENDDVLRAIAHAPERILGFVYLNPKHTQHSLEEMDRCVRNGPMVGVKLWVALRCHLPQLDPIVRRAVELQIPILQHTLFRLGGNLPGEPTPAHLAELAARHPDARFISAHNGGEWEQGIRAIRATKNVWAEVSGFDPTAGHVEMAVRELGARRVIWGSDAGGRSFASQLADVLGAEISAEEQRLILGENLRRLLAPALAAQGIKP